MAEIPATVVECDGCEKELNLLSPYLAVSVKPKFEVLLSEDEPTDNPTEVPTQRFYLGSKSGRGPAKGILKFHDFRCAGKWFAERKDLAPKLEYHAEDEVYVPEDNRTPEELVKAGELPKEFLAFHKKAVDFTPASVGGEEE